jgi:hypothetical protein
MMGVEFGKRELIILPMGVAELFGVTVGLIALLVKVGVPKLEGIELSGLAAQLHNPRDSI